MGKLFDLIHLNTQNKNEVESFQIQEFAHFGGTQDVSTLFKLQIFNTSKSMKDSDNEIAYTTKPNFWVLESLPHLAQTFQISLIYAFIGHP